MGFSGNVTCLLEFKVAVLQCGRNSRCSWSRFLKMFICFSRWRVLWKETLNWNTSCWKVSSFLFTLQKTRILLVNVNSRSLFAVARPSVCLSSVTFVRPSQAVHIFGNISTALGTLTSR